MRRRRDTSFQRACSERECRRSSTGAERKDVWASGDAYEPYVGRWSRLVANQFLQWLAIPPGLDWLDVGCGTGALTETIPREADPRPSRGRGPVRCLRGSCSRSCD